MKSLITKANCSCLQVLDIRWNSLDKSVEQGLMVSIESNKTLVEVRLKGNKFTQQFQEKVELLTSLNEKKLSNTQREDLRQLKHEIDTSSSINHTNRSCRIFYLIY